MLQLFKRRHENKKKKHSAMANPTSADHEPCRPMFAMICVNNVNRSTAAHDQLHAAGLRVCSYGAGLRVSFPGHTPTTPRVFAFATPYETMHQQLKKEDEELFTNNGVLQMLERDIATKKCPERWQALSNKQLQQIDIVVCLDYRMFLTVLEGARASLCVLFVCCCCVTHSCVRCFLFACDLFACALACFTDLSMRIRLSFKKKHMHIICLDVEDTPEDASNGGLSALALCKELDDAAATTTTCGEFTEERVKQIVVDFEKRHHTQLFYLGLRI